MTTNTSGGHGLLGILTIVFVVLKLTGNITWSWWWVLSPLWGGFILIVLFLFGGVALGILPDIFDGMDKRKKPRVL